MITSEVSKFGENSGQINLKILVNSLVDINNMLENLPDNDLKKMVGHKLIID